jgi:hypothetical protein
MEEGVTNMTNKTKIFQAGFLVKILCISAIAVAFISINNNFWLSIILLFMGIAGYWVYDWIHIDDLQEQIIELNKRMLKREESRT